MTDMTVKIRKVPCVRAHVRTQESLLYIIRHIRHPSPPLRWIANPTEQGSLGAPVFVTQRNRRNSKKQRKVSCVRAYVRAKYFYKNYCYYCYCYQ